MGGFTDTVSDTVRILETAGLSPDFIDLNEKKATILEKQVALFEHENVKLLRDNCNLALENQKLKSQLGNTPPKPELSEQTLLILKYFFAKADNGVSDREIACHFQVPMSIVTRHTYILWRKNFIAGHGLAAIGNGRGNSEATCAITVKGRAYCMENGLAA